jgi:hypothetical protein
LLQSSLSRHLDYFSDAQRAASYLKHGDTPPDASIAPRELAAYAAVASLILNLDETITKD